MKAIVCTAYGPPEVLQLKEVEKPTPGDKEILIKIKASAVNSGDVRIRKADPFAVRFVFGLRKPKKGILGVVFSGDVERIGKKVTRFRVGDQVFGSAGFGMGAYAEYKCLPEDAVMVLKPQNLSHTETAVIPFGGMTALDFLKKANIQPGQKVLIYGASGAVGTSAVQIAKSFGAIVTGVSSSANLDLLRSLGADHVIDYTKEDFTKNGETYDVIFDTVDKISFSPSLKSLSQNGILILGASGMGSMIRGLWASLTGKRKVLSGMIRESNKAMTFLKELAETGQLKPVIDRTYTLEQMAEAHAYVDRGHKKGNVAIEISGS